MPEVSFRVSAPGSSATEEQLRRLSEQIKGLQGNGQRAGSGLKQLGGAMNSLKGMAGALGLGLSIQRTGRFMWEAMAINRRYSESLNALGSRVGGGKVVKMLDDMQRGLDYEVSRTEAATLASRMLTRAQFMTAESMGVVTKYAKQYADATGQDLTGAIDQTSDALTSLRGTSLDAIGIHIDEAGAVDAAAKALGKKSSALDDATKKQAIYNAVIAEMQAQLKEGGGGGDPQAQMGAAWEDIKNTTGGGLSELYGTALQGLAQFTRGEFGKGAKNIVGGMGSAQLKLFSGIAGIGSDDAAGWLSDRAAGMEGWGADPIDERHTARARRINEEVRQSHERTRHLPPEHLRMVKIDKLTVRSAGGAG